jgi:hypothetical protein
MRRNDMSHLTQIWVSPSISPLLFWQGPSLALIAVLPVTAPNHRQFWVDQTPGILYVLYTALSWLRVVSQGVVRHCRRVTVATKPNPRWTTTSVVL